MINSAVRRRCAGFTIILSALATPAAGAAITITNEGAKSDSLLLIEVPELAAEWTSRCLNAEDSSEAQCWQSAAASARRFTAELDGPMIEDLRQLEAAWEERASLLAQREALRKEKAAGEIRAARARRQKANVEPVSESVRSTKFSTKTQPRKIQRKKIVSAVAQGESVSPEKEIQKPQATRASKRVQRSNFNTTWRRHYYGLRPGELRGAAKKDQQTGCLFEPCKGSR